MSQKTLFSDDGEGVFRQSVRKPPPVVLEPVSLQAKPLVSALDAGQWGVFALPDLLGTLRLHGLIVVKLDWLTEDMAVEDCRVAEILEETSDDDAT